MCNPRNLSMDFTKKVDKYKLSLDELQDSNSRKKISNYMKL